MMIARRATPCSFEEQPHGIVGMMKDIREQYRIHRGLSMGQRAAIEFDAPAGEPGPERGYRMRSDQIGAKVEDGFADEAVAASHIEHHATARDQRRHVAREHAGPAQGHWTITEH